MQTELTRRLAIRHPLLLAPMGGVSGGVLAAAVTGAGGLGLIGAGYGERDWLERAFDAAGDARVGVGFITWALDQQPALLDAALARAPAAVMFSFGDCAPYIQPAREAGANVLVQVRTVAEAEDAAAAGADIIVAQGTEGGGHGGSRSTFGLVPAVVDAVAPLPVVAAGGIADGRGLAAALMLGAGGGLVGTRFYASTEALGHASAKQRIVAAGGDDTLRTTVFDLVRGYAWPAHITARALANDFATRWHGREAALSADLARQKAAYDDADTRGDADTAVVFASEAADLVDAVTPAATIVERMTQHADHVLADHSNRVTRST
ncbi:NAD(P)H-dependent flavin oxidoreductase [Salinisphaera orenii]|uniref:NAD(P)H-dependent flavin oxidoreductase n=1 Tax=Salinisphaera orenii TaxID=856731 RepID=UPI000DBE4643